MTEKEKRVAEDTQFIKDNGLLAWLEKICEESKQIVDSKKKAKKK